MLSFFRRLTKSRLGIIFTLAFVGLIAVAFAMGDITGLAPGGAGRAQVVATVGGHEITEAELRERVQNAFNGARQQNPQLDMATFVASGAVDQIVDLMIDEQTVQAFATEHGMVASKRAVDGVIASERDFAGLDGKFDQRTYEEVLRQAKITDESVRRNIHTSMLLNWVLSTSTSVSVVGDQLALPYASNELERRHGTFAVIPTTAIPAGAAPDDKALRQYYTTNRARYNVPERRIMRYARVAAADVRARSAPTEAEIAAAYRAAGTRFSAREKRSFAQVIAPDQNTANAIAAQVKGGKPMADAARAAGLEASNVAGVEKDAFTRQSSAAVANAAFGAAQGSVAGPVKGPIGFHVIRVEKVEQIAARSLEQARAELVEELTGQKTSQALSDLQKKLDDGIVDGRSMADLLREAGLQEQRTPALASNGRDPDHPEVAPDPALAPIVAAGFAAEQGDDAQLVPMGQDGSFAVVALERIVPQAPRPFETIRATVLRDYIVSEQLKVARKAAETVVQAVNRGTPIEQALAATGLTLPKPETVDLSRQQIRAAGGRIPPQVALMFQMSEGKAKHQQAPNRGGYYIVYLERIERKDATGNTALIGAARDQLSSLAGREYAAQLVAAMRKDKEVTRNQAAIDRVKADLAGGAPAAN